ncbi:MAG TPA: hypothetical protein VFT82_03020, partial [Candidatus Paceibacterota bacterium]|nr:hypothetical protein [Candidatus Paceibacterota bacterium]
MTAETEEPRRRGPALASFLVVLTFIVVLVIAADLFFFSSCPSLSDLTNAKAELLAQTKFSAQAEADEHKRIRDEIATLQPSGQELIKVADSLMKITDLMANSNTATQDALNRQSQKLDQAIAAMSGISAGSSTDRASASAVLNDVSRKISELEAKLDSPPPLPTTPNTVSGIMTPPIPPQPPESKPADTTVVQVKPTPD